MDSDAVRHYEARELLADGRPVLIRAVRPDDKDALQELMRRLSPESSYLRFFQAKRELTPEEVRYYAEADFLDHVALVAIVREDGADVLIGTGRYFTGPEAAPGAADLTFVVDDAHQGLGAATHLLRHLVSIARAAGISELRAEVIADNRRMLNVFSRSGLMMRLIPAGPITEVRLALTEPAP